MPFKLIGTLVLVILVAVLTGFNLDNKCNIWLFYTFKDVPVIMTILISFVLGVIVTLPFTFGKKHGREDKEAPRPKKAKGKKNKTGDLEDKVETVPTVSDADAPSSSVNGD